MNTRKIVFVGEEKEFKSEEECVPTNGNEGDDKKKRALSMIVSVDRMSLKSFEFQDSTALQSEVSTLTEGKKTLITIESE
jgi:hypothetical protein